jgi:uncharacterized protein YjbJ (UPF0337 family)
MNWDTVKGDWKQFQGKVKEQWGKLTDDDLSRIEGRRDQLTGAIQKRYGIEKDEAEKQVSAFEHECGNCHEENRTGSEQKSQGSARGENGMNNPNKQRTTEGAREMHRPEQHGSMQDSKSHQSGAGGDRMKDKNMGMEKESKHSSGAQKEQSQTPRAKK